MVRGQRNERAEGDYAEHGSKDTGHEGESCRSPTTGQNKVPTTRTGLRTWTCPKRRVQGPGIGENWSHKGRDLGKGVRLARGLEVRTQKR